MDEQALLQRAQSGDRQAFEALVKLHEQPVYNLALRMCNNRDDAFDIAQEAFLKLFRGLSDIKGDSKLSTWLYRVTANAAIDLIRKRSRAFRFYALDDEDEPYDLPVPDYTFEPSNALAQAELRAAIYNALEQLKPDYRLAFILRELHGKSYTEIAAIMDCEEGTVKSRLFRARERLRGILTQNGNLS